MFKFQPREVLFEGRNEGMTAVLAKRRCEGVVVVLDERRWEGVAVMLLEWRWFDFTGIWVGESVRAFFEGLGGLTIPFRDLWASRTFSVPV